LRVLAGVQHSIAALGSWVNLGDKYFLTDWQEAWNEEIEPAMAFLKAQREFLQKPRQQARLAELATLLTDLKESQWWVKDIARTPGNQPARVTYLFEVQPLTTSIDDILMALLEQEKDQADGSERQELLVQFAQLQRLFIFTQLQLREILGETGLEYARRFRDSWQATRAVFNAIDAQQALLTPEQGYLLQRLQADLQAFAGLADKLIQERSAATWNIAHYWMEQEAAPLASRSIDLAAAMAEEATLGMDRGAAAARSTSVLTVWLLVLLIVVMLIVARAVSHRNARALAQPLTALSQATRELAAGRLMADIPVERADELGDLVRSFNGMRASMHQAQEALREVNASLEQRIAQRTAELEQANAILIQEIAERKQAEEALRESEARMRAIGDAVPDLLCELDEDGRYIEVLTGQDRLYRTNTAALKGRLLSEVHPPEMAGYFLAIIRRALATRQIQIAEYELELTAGRRWFESRTAPLEVPPPGSKPAVVVVARDITQRRAAEARLRQVQKMETIGHLTGGVAHDFNNLLAIVLGNLELLNEQLAGNPPLQDLVQRAVAAAERGATLTQRLLAYSRQQPLRAQPTDLNKLVKGILDLLQRTLGETIQIRTDLANDLWLALVDPAQFENALLNLALNARDAMPQGGVLGIETANTWLDADYAANHEDVKPGLYVMLVVSDNGVGMAPAVVEHAFEPFFTTKPVGKGSGLGLSMVYGLMKQSGGHVSIYSEEGQGTTVRLYLPQAQAEIVASRGEPLTEPMQQFTAATIMVVEDDAQVRKLTVNMLHSLGYQTVEAGDAWTALRLLAERPAVALLFTDVVLPGGMSGVELAREARQSRPELKVLFTSGYTEHALIHNGQVQDGVELLPKPYRKASLAKKVRAMLAAAPAAAVAGGKVAWEVLK
jgi:PAS domain S-box-containing protein